MKSRFLLATSCAVIAAATLVSGSGASLRPIRAAYFYGDMPAAHVDSLAAAGFDRALVKFGGDSVNTVAVTRIRALAAAALRRDMTFVPGFNLQSRPRLTALGTSRRYTWGTRSKVEPDLACPLDSAYWRSALLDRAEEFLGASSNVRSLLLDMEVYSGTIHHYDRGPCRCARCLAEYLGPHGTNLDAHDLQGLHAWEEVRLSQILIVLLDEFAARHPGVELGVFDLDLDSFVHRAMARSLARCKVPTVDYCEKTYAVGATPIDAVRGRLNALGLGQTPIVGGLWLSKWTPPALESAISVMNRRAQGFFVFTTFSLWFSSGKLTGPYTLLGSQAEYWSALKRANQAR